MGREMEGLGVDGERWKDWDWMGRDGRIGSGWKETEGLGVDWEGLGVDGERWNDLSKWERGGRVSNGLVRDGRLNS